MTERTLALGGAAGGVSAGQASAGGVSAGGPGERPTVLAPGGPNAIAVTTGIVGDEWTLWIVQQAMNARLSTYNEWLRAGPISSSVLTARLNRLVDVEIMDRAFSPGHPGRSRYRLTVRGRQMWPILLTMWDWERTWVHDPDESLPDMRHATCGQPFSPRTCCAACGEGVRARDVAGRFGPSGGWPRSVPAAVTRRRGHGVRRPVESVSQSMALIGNRWSAALLGAAFLGATRFGEFEQRMGAPPTVVADRLRTFADLGVLLPTPNRDRPDWVVYHLTDKGRAFYPVVASVLEWAQKWFQAPEGPALRITHVGCGRAFHPQLQCSACGKRLRGASVQVVRSS